jgi:putative membrane protein
MRMNKLVAVLSTVVLVACAKDAAKTDSTVITDSATSATTLPAPALTDANIAAILDEANAADSTFGKIASTKGTSADVRAYGVMMMNDHHALRKAGQDLVAKLGVTPVLPAEQEPMPGKAKMVSDSLNALAKGSVFDRSYIELEVANHQTVLGFIDQALAAAQNAEVKDLLTKARPNIEMHLKRAQEIQTKLGSAATD